MEAGEADLVMVVKALALASGLTAAVTLAAVCCGLPVLAAAASLGSAAWLAAHGLLLAIPVAVLATALVVRRRT